MLAKKILFGAGAAWASRAVSIILGLTLLPVLFRHMPQQDLAIWLLITQTLSAAAILDLGLGAALSRRIAFLRGRNGALLDSRFAPAQLEELLDLLLVGKRAYTALAATMCVALWIAGLCLLLPQPMVAGSEAKFVSAWTVLCVSQAIVLRSGIWTCALQGMGHVGWDAIFTSVVSACTTLCQTVLLLFGAGLVELAVTAAVGASAQRLLLERFVRARVPEAAARGRWQPGLWRSLVAPSFNAWLTTLGTTIVFNSDQFFAASAVGEMQFPAYRAAFILIHNITICAVAFGATSGTFVSQLWEAKRTQDIHEMLVRTSRLTLIIMLSAAAVLAAAGQPLFEMWLGKGHFAGYGVLTLLIASETLEAHCYVIAVACRATGDEAFALSSIAAAVLKIGLSFLLYPIFGLFGLALATTVALIATNHWYMVYRGLRSLQFRPLRYARDVVAPCAVYLLGVGAILGTLTSGLKPAGLALVALCGSVVAVAFIIATLTLVVGANHRTAIYLGLRQRLMPILGSSS